MNGTVQANASASEQFLALNTRMILVIDNYDSFAYNLARYFERLGKKTLVVRNDAIQLADIDRLTPEAVVLSPGPCTPREAGISLQLVRTFAGRLPILGVCLGHQTIAAAWGGRISRSPEPMHGRSSWIYHQHDQLYYRIPSPFLAGRYHSLIVDRHDLPEELVVTAWSEDQLVMGLRHRDFPVWGVQFHPESILTEWGYQILANFLCAAGLTESTALCREFERELDNRQQVARRVATLTPIPF